MKNILEQATAWLVGMQQEFAARPVTYRRGGKSLDVTATIGKTVFRTEDEFGRIQRFEARDFLIPASQLTLAPPERGDRVHESQDATTYIYEVMAPGKEPHFRFGDAFRRTIRVHTKLVDTQDT